MRNITLVTLVLLFAFLASGDYTIGQDWGTSIVDDCCCEVDTVLESNVANLNPILNDLVKTRFFKYFKLDLFSSCPFWAAEFLCGLGGCHICECNDDEVPMFWNQLTTDRVDRRTPADFKKWSDAPENLWILESNSNDMSYVNLQDYPEAYTGYSEGYMVWDAIYNENCFKGPLDGMCLEERMFYRLISGMHASISAHIVHNFEWNEELQEWRTNSTMFEDRLGSHPERVQNLYFAFIFLLRAMNKAAPRLLEYNYDTGHPFEDQRTKEMISTLLNVDLLCSPNFDESMLFTDPQTESLMNQTKNHFRNISQIMNCVTCEKCKVWSKVQVMAIGTALKILLEPDTNQVLEQLQRDEIISLVNTLRQFSNSIRFVEEMSHGTSPIHSEVETESTTPPFPLNIDVDIFTS